MPPSRPDEVEAVMAGIARRFPPEFVDTALAEVDRLAFSLRLVTDRKGTSISICDVGGGTGLFSLTCAALGMRSILVEADPRGGTELFDEFGIEVIARDFILEPLDLPPASLDAVTCFHTLEHVHNSPKRALHAFLAALKGGGLFALGGPNCVNLRKRITVPFGRGKWSSMEAWYERERFWDHVREPDVDDLRYIADDLDLVDVELHGRNFLGRTSTSPLVRTAAALSDHLLRLRPSLCSDIYVLGLKPV